MKKKIVFIAVSFSSFVEKDIDVLQKSFLVTRYHFKVNPKWTVIYSLIRQFIVLFFSCRKYNLIICQFAGHHTVLPVFFGKIFNIPVLIICGGTESVSFPAIRYGNFHKTLLSLSTRYSISNASHLAPKHQTLIEYNYTYDPDSTARQGLKAFIPELDVPYTIIENGYAPILPMDINRKKNSFITVAAGIEFPSTIPLKGIDLIMNLAKVFNDCDFTIVGSPASFKPPINLTNICWMPPTSQHQLIQLFSEHQFYLQLSMSEGFPNAICEAMLCGCIPIGSDVNAIPDIIGDTGYILHRKNIDELVTLVAEAIQQDENKSGEQSRNRILQHFPIENRSRKLTDLCNQLMQETTN